MYRVRITVALMLMLLRNTLEKREREGQRQWAGKRERGEV